MIPNERMAGKTFENRNATTRSDTAVSSNTLKVVVAERRSWDIVDAGWMLTLYAFAPSDKV